MGVLIDSKLSWKHHVSKISNTISRSLGIMYKLQPFLPLKIMKNVYYSLIYSHLVYGIEVWGSACKTELNKLLVLQKRAMRLLTYNDQYPVIPVPSNPIFIKVELLKVKEIFKYYISKFIFKFLQINFHSWFTASSVIHNYRTRFNFNIEFNSDSKNLFIPSARTTNCGLKQITVSGPKIWNDLPCWIKNNTSLNIFLKNLKAHLLANY